MHLGYSRNGVRFCYPQIAHVFRQTFPQLQPRFRAGANLNEAYSYRGCLVNTKVAFDDLLSYRASVVVFACQVSVLVRERSTGPTLR